MNAVLRYIFTRNGEPSSTKTLTFACWVVLTVVLLWKQYLGALSDEYVAIYIGAFVLNQMASTTASHYASTKRSIGEISNAKAYE